MITSGNKTWRNLQEQVAYLTAMIGQATDVVKNVQGIVATTGDLPAASSFTSGTTYAVGASAPYEYYVAIAGNWVDIGEFPQAGPAGADGENGKAIFLTSEATTSGTIAITAASIYNPDSLSIGKGDLILSDEGNVFAVTGPNSIPGYNVVYRFNIMGPTGATGATGAPGADGADGAPGAPGADGSIICYTAQTPPSTATTIPAGYVTSDIRTPAAGDMLIASNCNVFEITGLSGSSYTINYILNIEGATGSRGAQIGYTTETLSQVSASVPISTVTAAETVAPGDILVSVNGWIFIVSGISGSNLTGSCPTGANLTGPAGADGADGAPGSNGMSVFATSETTTSSTGFLNISNITVPTGYSLGAGNLIISASGDVFRDLGVGLDPSLEGVTYLFNIKGPAGNGNGTYYASTTTTNLTVQIPKADVNATPQAGDMIISASGDLFECQGELDANNWSVTFKVSLGDVVLVNYGTSSYYNTAVSVINQGKILVCKYGMNYYFATRYATDANLVTFIHITNDNSGTTIKRIWLRNNNQWTYNFATLLQDTAIASTITSTTTNQKIAGGKAVYDLVKDVLAPASAAAGDVWTADGNGSAAFAAPSAASLKFSTTEPTADNTDGDIKIVGLTSAPGTKYNGYIYINPNGGTIW